MTHGRCAACWLHAVRSFRGSFAGIPIPTLEPPTPRSSLYSCHHAFLLQCLVSSWSLDKARPVQIPLLHPAGKPTRWHQSLPHLVQAESPWVPTRIHQQLLSSLPSNYIATSCISPPCAPQPGLVGVTQRGSQLGPGLAPQRAARGSSSDMDIGSCQCPTHSVPGLLTHSGRPDSPMSWPTHSALLPRRRPP